MFKTLFFIIFVFGTLSTYADVKVRWLTVASVLIEDGKSRILFDPAWTRPKVKYLLGIENFVSDEALVVEILKQNKLDKIDAVFASHSHFDHVIDAPTVSKITSAVFYTDKSSERIAQAYNNPKIRTIGIEAFQKIRVGDFLITPLKRDHSQILHLFHFLPGEVPENTQLSFWDYHVGETWYYLVEHPDGVVLIDQGSFPMTSEVKKIISKVDVLIQGVANRRSDEVILDGYVKELSPQVFIPLHFDNFFADFSKGQEGDLIGIKLGQFLEKMHKAYPTLKADRPKYGQEILVLKSK